LLLFPGEEGQRQLGAALVQLQGRIQSLEHSAVKAQPSDTHHASVTAANAAALQVEKAPA
jgi:urease accessory protein UreF